MRRLFFVVSSVFFLWMLGTSVPAHAAVTVRNGSAQLSALSAPGLKSPSDNTTFQSMNAITMTWTLPTGTTQYQIQVIPAKNDGPGINLIRDAATTYTLDPPVLGQGPYVILPGMTYTWHVRATDKTTSVDEGDASWGPWSSDFTFTTPTPSAATIIPVEPPTGATVSSLTPRLRWQDSNAFIFYYELQLSKDQTFNTDPSTATASVYMNLIHGGQANPTNSWNVPANYPLEAGTRYFWRVRPRVQGSGAPVNWSSLFFFNTPGGAPSATATPTATPTPGTTATPTATAPATVSGCSWTGTWNTTSYTMYVLRLTQSGTSVTGTYGDSDGRMSGTVSGNQLTAQWAEGIYSGLSVQTIATDCNSFTGTWGFGSSSANGGSISGTRTTTTPTTSICSWTGTWYTTFGYMYLTQRGNSVTGTYGQYTYNISGTVSGNRLTGENWGGGQSSLFEFYMAANCNSFVGAWGNEDGHRMGDWNGDRVR